MLPAMTLRNVNVDQFLTLIGNEYPNIRITYIPDQSWKFPPLIEVDIKADPSQPVQGVQNSTESFECAGFSIKRPGFGSHDCKRGEETNGKADD